MYLKIGRSANISYFHITTCRLNDGLVNVGKSHNTAEFAVESIRQWWNLIGKDHYANARICSSVLMVGEAMKPKQKLEILLAGFGGRNWNSNNSLSFSAGHKQME